jgi:starch phosphorylase
VWLNNPRRPQEACGTSGMKAVLNGGLNLSILDGWWDEAFDGENGWAISSAEHVEDLERRDEVEAGSLFELLERQVVPLFYERWQGPVPRRWVKRVKRSLTTLGPFVIAARMVRDYTEQLYEPTAGQGDLLLADDHKRARGLAAWKESVAEAWTGVHVDNVEVDDGVADLGVERNVEAVVSLGGLQPDDVQVQLIHGPSGQGQELSSTTVVPMSPSGSADDGHLRYAGTFTCEQAGRYGVTVRIVPAHEDLVTPAELGVIAWA